MIHILHQQGYSIRQIAKEIGLDRRTVSKRLKEKELVPYKKREYKSKLDPFKDYIEKRFKENLPDIIPSSVIYQEIKKDGYKGKIRILQTYLAKLKDKYLARNYTKEEIIRFETKPGFQAQVDWSVIRSGKKPIYAFVMVMGYSRMAFVYFTNNMTQDTFVNCHIKAFNYFNGIPKTILYDNLKSVVIQRDKYGKNNHSFNNNFLDFAKKYKFVPKLCKPYRAKTKGKVERFNRYLKENFYKPLKSSLKNSNIKIDCNLLNTKIFSWLELANNRVHNTTKKRPIELFEIEKKYLIYYTQDLIVSNNKKITNDNNNKTLSNIPNIIIEQYTKLNDYEKLLIGVNNVA